MSKLKNLNRFQKAAKRPGQCRVNAPEVAELIRMSNSSDPEQRLTAASFLCPCHVRRRMDEAWQALYRMLEDADPRVQYAAWHTLDDGGGGETEAIQQIADRVMQTPIPAKLRHLIEEVCGPRLQRQRLLDHVAGAPIPGSMGKCDFCDDRTSVTTDYDTPIPDGASTRPANICTRCAVRR